LNVNLKLRKREIKMNRKSIAIGIVVMLLMAGCASQATTAPTAMMEAETPTVEAMMENSSPTPEAMMENSTATSEAMMENDTATPEAMMENGTPTSEAMMGTAMPGTGEMMSNTATPEAMAPTEMAMTETVMSTGTPSGMMMGDEWLGIALIDVNSDKSFKLSDYQGKTVLVELISTQSSLSLLQQKSIQAIATGNPDLVVVSLDISSNENMDSLHSHVMMNTFQWSFAMAPADVVNEIGAQYGSQYTDPANLPMLAIDQKGVSHALPLNLTGQDQIKQALAEYLPNM
jgi:hypothetical protein